MRTTLNLDPEVLSTVRLLSKQRGLPIGTIVSEIVRKALQQGETAVERNGVQIFPRREGPAPDIATVNNVAMFDGAHVNHESAHAWFGSIGLSAWATCPIKENGVIRVLSNPSYPTVTAPPNEVARRLATFCSQPNHEFLAG